MSPDPLSGGVWSGHETTVTAAVDSQSVLTCCIMLNRRLLISFTTLWGRGGEGRGGEGRHMYHAEQVKTAWHFSHHSITPSLHLASNPGSHPAFSRLQSAFRTASNEKLDESLGSRLPSISPSTHLLQLVGLLSVICTLGSPAVGHSQPPHRPHAVDIVSHPGIVPGPSWRAVLVEEGRQQACHRMLQGGRACHQS